jgi:NAD(P)-dependent dehydrogenase (short-subunit alcohol dehydrogenase family)
MQQLKGRVAFVTGGANGIGQALARILAAEGMAVAVADIDGTQAERQARELVARGAQSVGLKLDVCDLAGWQRVADRVEQELGPVALLCSNAGVASAQSIYERTPIEKISPAEWQWLLGVNLEGQFNGLKTFLPRFKARPEPAHVLATASMAGIVPQSAEVPGAYTVSKFAVIGLYEQLRLELVAFPHIGLTLLCPGVVRTSIQSHSLAIAPYLDEHERLRKSDNPYASDGSMKFGMEPDNVARAAVAAIRDSRFYAFTHPEYGPLTRAYHQSIEDAFGASAQPGYIDPLPA